MSAISDHTPIPLKCCTKCKTEYPATNDHFHNDKNRADGLFPWCKPCVKRQRTERKDVYKITTKQWQVNNREKYLANKRREYRRHKDRYYAYSRAKIAANPERNRAYKRKSKKLHPDTDRAARERRAERKKTGAFTKKDAILQLNRQHGRCYYCGCDLTGIKYHTDHIIPLSRGGAHDPSNIVIACPKCNTEKGQKLPHEWGGGGRLL